MYLTLLNCTLKNSKFCVIYILPQLKIKVSKVRGGKLISRKVDFRANNITRDKQVYFITKCPIHQEEESIPCTWEH